MTKKTEIMEFDAIRFLVQISIALALCGCSTQLWKFPAHATGMLKVSGDQYNGYPQIQVLVDGQQIGGLCDVTADHSLGQTQIIPIPRSFDPSAPHSVRISFINDAWDNTAWWSSGISPDGHDRNVYVSSVTLNGVSQNGRQGTSTTGNSAIPDPNPFEAPMHVNGMLTFQFPAQSPTAPSANPAPATGPAPNGAAFYVDPNGNDGNSGTSAGSPFQTLERAQSAMRGSSIKTTYLRAGTYNRSSSLNLGSSDSGETWSYYPPDGVDSAVLDGGGSTDLMIIAGSKITINGLKLQNVHSYAMGVQDGGTGTPRTDSVVIENCDMGFNQHPGTVGGFNPMIFMENSTNIQIKNNYVHDTVSQGIGLYAYYAGQLLLGR